MDRQVHLIIKMFGFEWVVVPIDLGLPQRQEHVMMNPWLFTFEYRTFDIISKKLLNITNL